MKLKFLGARGSLPRPLSPLEIVQRITSQLQGRQLTLPALKRLADSGGLGYSGNTSCVVLESGSERLIIDGGSGIRKLSHECAVDKKPVHLLMTHFHWDHVQGIPFFAPLYIPGRTVHVYSSFAPEEARASFAGQFHEPFFPVSFEQLAADIRFHRIPEGGKLKIGPFVVKSMPLHHPQPTYSYRVECGGRNYVHASDTEISLLRPDDYKRYQKFFRGADAISVDSQWNFNESLTHETWGHSSMHHFLELLAGLDIGKVYYFHYNPQVSEAHVDETLASGKRHLKLAYPKSRMKLLPAVEDKIYTV